MEYSEKWKNRDYQYSILEQFFGECVRFWEKELNVDSDLSREAWVNALKEIPETNPYVVQGKDYPVDRDVLERFAISRYMDCYGNEWKMNIPMKYMNTSRIFHRNDFATSEQWDSFCEGIRYCLPNCVVGDSEQRHELLKITARNYCKIDFVELELASLSYNGYESNKNTLESILQTAIKSKFAARNGMEGRIAGSIAAKKAGFKSDIESKEETKIYCFLEGCSEEDMYKMIDTGIFNGVIMKYAEVGMLNEGVDSETRKRVLSNMHSMLDISNINSQEIYNRLCKDSLNNYYFTFGDSPDHAYCGGWITIQAQSIEQACERFRKDYPDNEPGLLSCAGVYTEQEFIETGMLEQGNRGNFEHKRIVCDAPNPEEARKQNGPTR